MSSRQAMREAGMAARTTAAKTSIFADFRLPKTFAGRISPRFRISAMSAARPFRGARPCLKDCKPAL